MESVSVSDHLATDDGDYPDGIYRVVGTADGAVTALRVGAADGRRIHTGEVVTIEADDLEGFVAVEDLDRSRSIVARLVTLPSTGYWSARAFASQLRARPVPSAVAMALFVTGAVGDPVVPAPEPVLDAMVLVGGLGLAAIGSGRL